MKIFGSILVLAVVIAAVLANERARCICTHKYDPVCGTDGMTYSNPCRLQCMAKNHPGLTIKHRGTCASGTRT